MQVTGSFKERGARYFCEKLTDDEKKLGVVTASAGNHAQALARHGKITGTNVTVVMPMQAPLVKVNSCRHRGVKGVRIVFCWFIRVFFGKKCSKMPPPIKIPYSGHFGVCSSPCVGS